MGTEYRDLIVPVVGAHGTALDVNAQPKERERGRDEQQRARECADEKVAASTEPTSAGGVDFVHSLNRAVTWRAPRRQPRRDGEAAPG